jgi:hypothetical protein
MLLWTQILSTQHVTCCRIHFESCGATYSVVRTLQQYLGLNPNKKLNFNHLELKLGVNMKSKVETLVPGKRTVVTNVQIFLGNGILRKMDCFRDCLLSTNILQYRRVCCIVTPAQHVMIGVSGQMEEENMRLLNVHPCSCNS